MQSEQVIWIFTSKGRNKRLQRHDWCSGFFWPASNNDITYEKIKITIGQGDDYTTDCLLDYLYFKENPWHWFKTDTAS